jgi:hypothetical protein
VVVNYNEIKKLFNLILIEINYSGYPCFLRAKPFLVKRLQQVEIPRTHLQNPLCQPAKWLASITAITTRGRFSYNPVIKKYTFANNINLPNKCKVFADRSPGNRFSPGL